MKKKILTLIALMLCFACLTACGGSNDNSSSNAAQDKETSTADSMETPTAETIEQSETKESDDFISMAKEMFYQYHDNEDDFYNTIDKIKEAYKEREIELWIGDSSYSYMFDTFVFSYKFNNQYKKHVEYSTTSVYSNCYSVSRNGETLENFANNLSTSNNTTSDVTFKTINGLDMAHFTFETEEEESYSKAFYYNECYIANDEKDDEFLVLTYKYDNVKKDNDYNSNNPEQMNSDHYDYFLATAISAQTIFEHKKVEAELVFSEKYSGIAINVPESYTKTYEINVPIEGSDDYDVISGREFYWGNFSLNHIYITDMHVYSSNDSAMKSDAEGEYEYKLHSTIREQEATLEEININGFSGYLVTYRNDLDSGVYLYIYYLENGSYYIKIPFVIDEEFVSYNQIDAIMNSAHIIEK